MAQLDNQNRVTLPSAEEMEAAVDSLPPLISKNLEAQSNPINTQSVANAGGIKLANTPEDLTQEVISAEPIWPELQKKIIRYFPKILGIGLTLQSLRGIYNSVAFILVDYPILEQKLVAHQITEVEVTELTITMVLMLLSTMISLFFAMRLTLVKAQVMKRVSTAIGILLLVANPFLHDLLEASNFTGFLVGFFTESVQTIHEAPKQVIESVPFLEENPSGQLDTVWYK